MGILFSYMSDPATWAVPDTGSMKCAGAKFIQISEDDDGDSMFAARTADGKFYHEPIDSRGPLPALGRLAMKIRKDLEFGKKRRNFRTKQRSILCGKTWTRN